MSVDLKPSVTFSGSIVRPRYSPGLVLLDEDLTAAVDHSRSLSRLLFRSLFGCGVICGFDVKHVKEDECRDLTVIVNPGVALDCHGDPIEMCGAKTIGLTCGHNKSRLWLVVCKTTDLDCFKREVICPSDDDSRTSVPTRTRDGFELKLVLDEPRHACGCLPPATAAEAAARAAADYDCHKEHNDGQCQCECCGDSCVVLAQLDRGDGSSWNVSYGVRRFIRPRLLDDPRTLIRGSRDRTAGAAAPASAAAPTAPAAAPTAADTAAAAAAPAVELSEDEYLAQLVANITAWFSAQPDANRPGFRDRLLASLPSS